MNKLIPSFGMILIAAWSWAGEEVVSVTPQSIGAWTLIGVDRVALAQGRSLSLPSAAQMERSFAAPIIAVKLVTQPVFSSNAADWPVLEIGSAALVFLRNGNAGKLALVLGEDAPIALPFVIGLGPDGRSAEPLDLVLTPRGASVGVSFRGQTLLFSGSEPADSSPPASPPGRVAASAGADQSWSLDSLAVILSEPKTELSGPAASPTGGPEGRPESVTATRTAVVEKLGRFYSQDPGRILGGSPANARPVEKPQTGGLSTLEVFTPPSVRHGRADAVRAAIAEVKNF